MTEKLGSGHCLEKQIDDRYCPCSPFKIQLIHEITKIKIGFILFTIQLINQSTI